VEWLENGSSNFYELQQQQPQQRKVSGILFYSFRRSLTHPQLIATILATCPACYVID